MKWEPPLAGCLSKVRKRREIQKQRVVSDKELFERGFIVKSLGLVVRYTMSKFRRFEEYECRKVKEFYEKRGEFESGKGGRRYVRGDNKKLKTLLRMLRNESYKVVLKVGCGRGSYLKSILELLNAEPVDLL
ncbi:MAG: hypothetical protein OCU24_00900 [Candidatus Methanospirare jalkutatii]|nr:hypothetical protein [Candidatus Methanospirare jalkutatii]